VDASAGRDPERNRPEPGMDSFMNRCRAFLVESVVHVGDCRRIQVPCEPALSA
jgi:hypothetical protein